MKPSFLSAAVLGVALVISVAIASCAALGITQPLSLDEKLASAQGSVTAVVNAATQAVSAGSLSSDSANQVLTMAKTASGFIATARSYEAAGNTTGAQQELAVATSALAALQTYVNSHLPSTAPAPPAPPPKPRSTSWQQSPSALPTPLISS